MKKCVTLFSVFIFVFIFGFVNASAATSQTKLKVSRPECLTNSLPWRGESQSLKDKVEYFSPSFKISGGSIKIRTNDPDHNMDINIYECHYGTKVATYHTGKVNNGWSEIPVDGLIDGYTYYVGNYYFTLFGATDTIKSEIQY
ncbi:hypothetical protein KHQ81_10995 [Mycoplasmatota bacterium]|nr:hypothetical protein KHQ81_10995 [Mycoplasmatota bacterium]